MSYQHLPEWGMFVQARQRANERKKEMLEHFRGMPLSAELARALAVRGEWRAAADALQDCADETTQLADLKRFNRASNMIASVLNAQRAASIAAGKVAAAAAALA